MTVSKKDKKPGTKERYESEIGGLCATIKDQSEKIDKQAQEIASLHGDNKNLYIKSGEHEETINDLCAFLANAILEIKYGDNPMDEKLWAILREAEGCLAGLGDKVKNNLACQLKDFAEQILQDNPDCPADQPDESSDDPDDEDFLDKVIAAMIGGESSDGPSTKDELEELLGGLAIGSNGRIVVGLTPEISELLELLRDDISGPMLSNGEPLPVELKENEYWFEGTFVGLNKHGIPVFAEEDGTRHVYRYACYNDSIFEADKGKNFWVTVRQEPDQAGTGITQVGEVK